MVEPTPSPDVGPRPIISAWRTPRVRFAGALLFVGSVQFIVAMFVEQALRPGYSDTGNFISDLGVNSHGWGYDWVFNSSVILLGVLGVTGLVLLVPTLPRKVSTHAGEVLIAVGTLGAIAVGLFPETSTALWGHAHQAASIIAFADANLGMLVLGLSIRHDRIWGPLAAFTALLGLFSTLALVFYVQSYLTDSGYLGIGPGGLERAVTFPVLIWAIVLGWFTNRHETPSPVGKATTSEGPQAA